MKKSLNYERREAKSKKAKSCVIFLHGYGANGLDLINIADSLQNYFPNTVFLAPDAPKKCSGSPNGFQWFQIPWIDGCSKSEYQAGVAEASVELNIWIDFVLKQENIKYESTILFGFSQGTMIGLHIGLRQAKSLAGIIGFSGSLIESENLNKGFISKCPILLIHGAQDEVVPASSMEEAKRILESFEIDVKTLLCDNLGHGISPEGLQESVRFMKETL